MRVRPLALPAHAPVCQSLCISSTLRLFSARLDQACESSCSRMAGRRLLVRAQALERAHTTAGEPRCGRFQTTRPRPPLASDPDPLGATMKRVGEVLALYQKYGTHGVFWDFGSLMQHSPLPDGPRRTPEEQALFIEGLSASSLYYAHSETTVFRLTTWPQGYPDGYELAGANVAQYIDRGWCFSESCWSALTKDFAKSLDLGLYSGTKRRLHGTNGVLAECADSRHPPLLPGEFAKQARAHHFAHAHPEPRRDPVRGPRSEGRGRSMAFSPPRNCALAAEPSPPRASRSWRERSSTIRSMTGRWCRSCTSKSLLSSWGSARSSTITAWVGMTTRSRNSRVCSPAARCQTSKRSTSASTISPTKAVLCWRRLSRRRSRSSRFSR
mmetsp:Transcript_11577/g.34010  ORF Transcript_11577/g.34010 Transcript_11577/m.34010 type:complete len:384 (-) Transcript_11577:365-1516(-)